MYIIIVGGGSIGFHLCKELLKAGHEVLVLDKDVAKCDKFEDDLGSVCMRGDGCEVSALSEAGTARADVFIAATSDDERNIMASVLAKDLGAARTISVVHQPDFASLVRKLGIDHAVTPRASIANRILRLVHQKEAASLAVVGDGEVEILELSTDENAPGVGKPLKEVRMPRDSLIASILRGEKAIIPGGDDVIEPGDSIIVITSPESWESVEKLFHQ